MTEHFGLILDSMVIILLMATIFYAAILSRRLSQLRRNRKDLDGAIRSLAEAAARADNGIKGLKQTAEETGARLQSQIDRANALRDELAMLVDTGDRVAERHGAADLPAGARRNGAAAYDPEQAVVDLDDADVLVAPRRRAATGKSGVIRAQGWDAERRTTRADRLDPSNADLMKVIDNMR